MPGKGAFNRCVEAVAASGRARSPRGVCASAGRAKYGKARFQKMAAAGRKRAAKNSAKGKGYWVTMQRTVTNPARGGRTLNEGKGYRVTQAEAAQLVEKGYARSRHPLSKLKSNLPIDPYAIIYLPSTLKTLDRERKKLVAKVGKKNGLFTKRVTYHARIVRGESSKPAKKRKPRYERAALSRRGLLNPGRKNPVPAAQERYASFHGRPSEELVKILTPLHEHSVLAGIGYLRKLVVIAIDGHKVVIKNFGENKQGQPCILAMNEEATQLFVDGGDQSVNLADFGIYEPYHEMETLGQVKVIDYYTTKDHLGADGGEATYRHKFGGMREVTVRGRKVRKRSELPYLLYDVRNQLLSFSGGGYTIPDEGIEN